MPVQEHLSLAAWRRGLPEPGAVVPVVQGRRVRAGPAGGRGEGITARQKQQAWRKEEEEEEETQ